MHHQHSEGSCCPPRWARVLITNQEHVIEHLHRIEHIMTEVTANQAHLDTDIAAITDSFATVIAELKAAAAAGTPLDFAAADALVAAVQAEAAADAPPVV